jgi:hypothetical protein
MVELDEQDVVYELRADGLYYSTCPMCAAQVTAITYHGVNVALVMHMHEWHAEERIGHA